MLELWGLLNTLSLPPNSGPLWLGVVAPNWVLPMGHIELNCVLMLNGIGLNRFVLTFKLRTDAKLNQLKYCIVICWFMQKYTYICWIHTDAMNNRRTQDKDAMIKSQEDFFIKIYTSHFIARVRKGCSMVCVWEGAGDRT